MVNFERFTKILNKINDKHYEEKNLQMNVVSKNKVYEIKIDWNKFDGKDLITLLNKMTAFKMGSIEMKKLVRLYSKIWKLVLKLVLR